uniref:Uncharacterized protein n=1 Tax=Rhizophora mucronata TaxID=61149 RepID=A0A2P2L2Y9_RHIMU
MLLPSIPNETDANLQKAAISCKILNLPVEISSRKHLFLNHYENIPEKSIFLPVADLRHFFTQFS